MYTGVHSDASWESDCTSKEQATFTKASQALDVDEDLCFFYSSSDQNNKLMLM